jgi:hypothetical protein
MPLQKVVAMTELLKSAVAKLQTLPESEQNAIASAILEEIEDEQRWDAAFAKSPDVLVKLAATALANAKGEEL